MDDKRAPAALGEDRLGDANREGVIDTPGKPWVTVGKPRSPGDKTHVS